MSEAFKELINQGALGAGLVLTMATLAWIGKLLANSYVKQMEATTKAMTELVEAARAIRDNCRTCRSDSLASIRDAQVAIEHKVDTVVWEAHRQALAGTAKEIAAAFARAEKERMAERLDDERSRPHTFETASAGVVRR
jgi:hypothetical protein